MDEDMQLICDFLLMSLQRTRAGWKVVRLVYAAEPGRETVNNASCSWTKL